MRHPINVLFDASARTGILYFMVCLQYVLEETKMPSLNVLNTWAFLFVKQWWIEERKMKDEITRIFLPCYVFYSMILCSPEGLNELSDACGTSQSFSV